MLDDCVGDPSSLGGVLHLCLGDSQLVDNADEGTRPHRWPDGENTHADHSSINLGNGDRRGWNEEQVAQVVDVVTPASLVVIMRKHADDGIEIGHTGAADVYLHVGLIGSGSQTGMLRDDPPEDTTASGELPGPGSSTLSTVTQTIAPPERARL